MNTWKPTIEFIRTILIYSDDSKKVQVGLSCEDVLFDSWYLKSIILSKQESNQWTFFFTCDGWLNENVPVRMLNAQGKFF